MTTKTFILNDLEKLEGNGASYSYYRLPEKIDGSDLIMEHYVGADDTVYVYLVYPDKETLVYQEQLFYRGGSGKVEITVNDDGSVVEETMWS